ncbi:MAG: response regulator [Anaerolineales bacterium]|nr:response regulator [Anaerolineales bacterium]
MSALHRVLVVEDDRNAFELLKIALSSLPLDVANAASGQQAIAQLAAELPELIFLDIDLPDMHGWQILEHFKDTGRLRPIPVIVLTAHGEPVHRLIGSLQAVAVFLRKPFKADEVRAHVRQLLSL